MPVEMVQVRHGPLDHSISAIGILQANDAVIIRPEVSGRITKLLFKEGQPVEKGEVLITLEDDVAQANLKEANAEYQLRKAEFARAETLLQRGAGSITDKDTAFSKLEVSTASLAKAQSMVSHMSLLAPFEGVVGLRKVSVGDFVTPGQELVNLVDLDPIKVEFRVPEIYLKQIKIDQNVDVTTNAFPKIIFVGKIYAIDPQIDPIGHSILVRALIDNKTCQLRPGLFTNLQVILKHIDNALFIPAAALMPQEQKQFVFRVENNVAILTEVKTGIRKDNEVEILEGLKPDDVVITAGQMKIGSGSKVTSISTVTSNQSPELE